MTRLKPLLALFCALLLAAPMAHADGGGIDLTDRLDQRLHQGVEQAKKAETPARQRLILSETFRSMSDVLERAKTARGLSDAEAATLRDLQRDINAQHDRLNGLNGFAPVPDADLDRFTNSAPQILDLNNRTITIGLGTAALIVILIILLA